MEQQIHTVHFKADKKLLDFIHDKINKLQLFNQAITSIEVFLILENEIVRDINLGNEPEYLDQETSQYLREHAKNHALLYEQVEGTRKVLQNVK